MTKIKIILIKANGKDNENSDDSSYENDDE